jgi:hypothetical protein
VGCKHVGCPTGNALQRRHEHVRKLATDGYTVNGASCVVVAAATCATAGGSFSLMEACWEEGDARRGVE